MATTNGAQQTGQVVATWLPTDLAERLHAQAKAEERSVSQVVKRALRTQLNEAR